MKEYGAELPPNLFDSYGKYVSAGGRPALADGRARIDIPIRFVMGLRDHLINPKNVLKHYHILCAVQPELAFLKTFECGHIDFVS